METLQNFECNHCNYVTKHRGHYNKHIHSLSHDKNVGNSLDEQIEHLCIVCDYKTMRRSDYDRHLLSRSHFAQKNKRKIASKSDSPMLSYTYDASVNAFVTITTSKIPRAQTLRSKLDSGISITENDDCDDEIVTDLNENWDRAQTLRSKLDSGISITENDDRDDEIVTDKNENVQKSQILRSKLDSGIDGHKNVPTHKYLCECERHFQTRSGLYKHKQKCKGKPTPPMQPFEMMQKGIEMMATKMMEQQNHAIELIVDQMATKFASSAMSIVAANSANQTTTNISNSGNSMNNSHNKTFNLNFFLNEECKDAMNIMDFIRSIPITVHDLEQVGDKGYVEGMAHILSTQLSSLDIHKRPIHCSDAKRQVLHVKHEDKWQKEQEGYPIFRNALKDMGQGLFQSIGKWSVEHPQAMNSQSHWNDIYLRILKQATGGHGDYEENNTKIMKKLAKLVVINRDA